MSRVSRLPSPDTEVPASRNEYSISPVLRDTATPASSRPADTSTPSQLFSGCPE